MRRSISRAKERCVTCRLVSRGRGTPAANRDVDKGAPADGEGVSCSGNRWPLVSGPGVAHDRGRARQLSLVWAGVPMLLALADSRAVSRRGPQTARAAASEADASSFVAPGSHDEAEEGVADVLG